MTLVARRSLGREPGREAEIQWETYRDWTEGQLSALLEEQCGRLVPADKEAERAAAFRFSKIAKPLGSLGVLEEDIIKIAGMTGSAAVKLDKKALIIFCADNGVVEEGVTQTGQELSLIHI